MLRKTFVLNFAFQERVFNWCKAHYLQYYYMCHSIRSNMRCRNSRNIKSHHTKCFVPSEQLIPEQVDLSSLKLAPLCLTGFQRYDEIFDFQERSRSKLRFFFRKSFSVSVMRLAQESLQNMVFDYIEIILIRR